MTPLMRTWAIVATGVALLLALRGAWPLALACFLLSPAPAWAFAHAPGGATNAPAAWLRTVAIALAIVVALYVAALAAGGLPPMHEWRAALFGR
jgi:hypothetical protein